MKIDFKKLPFDEDRKREDIDKSKLYLVKYDKRWFLGRFNMQWYGWVFEPNYGIMHMQIECLDCIYDAESLK